MTTASYIVGRELKISGSCKTIAGIAADPTGVVLKIQMPDGTESQLEYGVDAGLTRSAVGEYSALVTLTEAGQWAWRWVATGALVAAAEGKILALASQFKNP